MILGQTDKELTQLNEIELDKRLASVAKSVHNQLGDIIRGLTSERELYPGSLYDQGDFIMELRKIIGIAQNDILRAYEKRKNK